MVLLSMTGQGLGRRTYGQSEVTVEVRAVNNRYFKLQARFSNAITGLESKVEGLIRQKLRRGSLQLAIHVSGKLNNDLYTFDTVALENYYQQIKTLAAKLGQVSALSLAELAALPGVVVEKTAKVDEVDTGLEEAVLAAVGEAMDCLNRMRLTEGQSMSEELVQQLSRLRQLTEAVEVRAPMVIEEYRQRLINRLGPALAEVGAQIQDSDLIREVLLMTDKFDIREEIVRLRSHFDQFQLLVADTNSQGRKLDFLIQEIFRESNTIGSKANDAEIAQRVVDMKSIIEQMRELVQNVE